MRVSVLSSGILPLISVTFAPIEVISDCYGNSIMII